jgi:hypothetical protein
MSSTHLEKKRTASLDVLGAAYAVDAHDRKLRELEPRRRPLLTFFVREAALETRPRALHVAKRPGAVEETEAIDPPLACIVSLNEEAGSLGARTRRVGETVLGALAQGS